MMVETLLESAKLVEGRKIYVIPMQEIITDLPGFNCRGKVEPKSVLELADLIRTQGLLFPVTIWPYVDPKQRPEKKYLLVAGYRRYMAHLINKAQTIEAEIRWDLDEMKARILNLTENLEREELNLMQEARAFEGLQTRYGMTGGQIAKHIDRSPGWVEVRMKALTLEPEIQTEIEKRMLNSKQILAIATLGTSEERYAAVRQLKVAKLRGDKRMPQIGKKKPRSVFATKRREPTEIYEMQDHMLEEFGGGSLAKCPPAVKYMIRALGWASGDATDMEIYETLRLIAQETGKHYNLPEDVLDIIKSAP